jgi:hypothetical protein
MSIGTNRNAAYKESSAELLAKAKDYEQRGLTELAKSWKKSAERLKRLGR